MIGIFHQIFAWLRLPVKGNPYAGGYMSNPLIQMNGADRAIRIFSSPD